MTGAQKNVAVVQAAERLFDFASEHIPQPTPKAAQDFADPDNYWHRAALAALPQPAPVTGGEDAELAQLIQTRLLGVDPGDQDLQLEDDDWRRIIAAVSPSAPEAPSERGVGDWHPRIGEEVRPSENMIERWPDWRDTRLWVVGVTLDRNVVGNPTRVLNVCVSDEWPVTNRTGGFTDGFYINRDHAPDDLVPLTRARKIGGNHHGS